jgi:SAM-dependent methyltransferase
LLHQRHADDPAYGQVVQSIVESCADRVLDGAQLATGMTLLDVGAGEGLVAFRAIDRIGPSLRVMLTDVSAPMLRHAESVAVQRNVRAQCTFIECTAENLSGIADASVDVVATRAALAYVADKKAAFGEFFRTLKPGGRLSIAEPILQDEAFYARALRRRVEDQSLPADPVPGHGGVLRQKPDHQLFRARFGQYGSWCGIRRDSSAASHRRDPLCATSGRAAVRRVSRMGPSSPNASAGFLAARCQHTLMRRSASADSRFTP